MAVVVNCTASSAWQLMTRVIVETNYKLGIRISSLVACAKSQDLNEQRTEFQIIAAVLFSVDRFFLCVFVPFMLLAGMFRTESDSTCSLVELCE